jgi:hypothetical protein
MDHPSVASREPLWPGAPVCAEILDRPVVALAPHEVFVFGSNSTGFHGAGSAGLACRGDAANTWRRDAWFQAAMRSAPGASARRGRWAVFGVARGPQEGTSGRSYAIQTITHPGRRRSTSRREIYRQLVALVSAARANPDDVYVITPLGEGYSGYSRAEMSEVWREVHGRYGIPDSFRFVRVAGRGAALT